MVPGLASSAASGIVSRALFKRLADAGASAAAVNAAALVGPVGCTEVNLHPVPIPGMTWASGLGERRYRRRQNFK
jgi:hypothetical protein